MGGGTPPGNTIGEVGVVWGAHPGGIMVRWV